MTMIIIGDAVENYIADWVGGGGRGTGDMARFTLFTHSRKGGGF